MDTRPGTLLEDGAALEKVGTGAVWAEGPTWVPQRNAVRYSDVRSNRILEYSETTGELSVYGQDVEFTNGRALDPDGSVVQCSHGRRAIERDRDGTVETLVDRFGEVRFNSPNDVVVKSDGTIWFSDPTYGIDNPAEGHGGEPEYGDRYVFRFDPASGELTAVITDIVSPNGLAFSPDESVLYVSDTAEEVISPFGPAQEAGNPIRAYDVVEGRQVKNGRVFVRVTPGVPDGFRVDTGGNVWSSGGDGVRVFSPEGKLLEHIPVPETVSNVCFGGPDGRTLYMTATSSLYRIRTTASDAAAALRARS